jgi:glycopeptide antibiotics resistance protein
VGPPAAGARPGYLAWLVPVVWFAWWSVWALLTLPWRGLESAPQWQRMEWLPFGSARPRDWALNLLFFVPFGVLGVAAGWRARRVVVLGALVALAAEALQLFSRYRFPATTDVVLDVIGVALGVAAAGVLRNGRDGRREIARSSC